MAVVRRVPNLRRSCAQVQDDWASDCSTRASPSVSLAASPSGSRSTSPCPSRLPTPPELPLPLKPSKPSMMSLLRSPSAPLVKDANSGRPRSSSIGSVREAWPEAVAAPEEPEAANAWNLPLLRSVGRVGRLPAIVTRPKLFKGWISEKDRQQRRIAALEALIEAMGPGTPLLELVGRLMKDVVLSNGETAFSQADVADAVFQVQQSSMCSSEDTTDRSARSSSRSSRSSGRSQAGAASASALKAIRIMAEASPLGFDEAFGQLIWRHRRSEALQGRCHRRVVDDLDWATEGGVKAGPGVAEAVEKVFRRWAKEGRMDATRWRKVVQLLEANPVLKARMRHEDPDRLFWSETHQCGQVQRCITLPQFRSLLAQLAECWQVHPFVIFNAVGSHQQAIVAADEEH